jgi:hypothetical protein
VPLSYPSYIVHAETAIKPKRSLLDSVTVVSRQDLVGKGLTTS